MKKIIVAGAGHGGLTAAYNLALKGYDVTVFEMKNKEDLGYDWHDAMDLSAFDFSEVPRPGTDSYLSTIKTAYISPDAEKIVDIPLVGERIYMDRKVLCAYLVECCENVGVKFIFGKPLKGPLVSGDKVSGIITADGEVHRGDLVIDACGMHSPIRRNLPEICMIQKEITERDIFYVYRAYFKNTTGEKTDPPYLVTLFHMNRPGIGWMICEDDYVDILVGKFGMAGKLTEKEIEEDIAQLREQYPFIGTEIVRGGDRGEIPLRRMVSKIVCDGYAAAGDSAGMTIPLNGSGIILSMKAGKILADTVIAMGEKECTTENLWGYEYEYYQSFGDHWVFIDILKNFFVYLKSDHINLFMKRDVLSADKFAVVDGGPIRATPLYIAKVIGCLPFIMPVVPKFLMSMKSVPALPVVKMSMPKKYNKKDYIRWAKLYNAL